MRRAVGLLLLSSVFALFAIADLIQLFQAARGHHPDPPILLLIHGLTGLLAGVAAVALWKARSWAPVVLLVWCAVTVSMLMVLGPVLDEPQEVWQTYWFAAGLIAFFGAGAAWYARRAMRRSASAADFSRAHLQP